MKLNEEQTRMRLQVDTELSAAELDALIRQLALARADMTPPVPSNRADLGPDAEVLVEDKPGLVIARRSSGGFRLWLRHRGFGWLGFQVDDDTAASMSAFVASKTPGPTVNLIDHDDPKRH